MDGVERAGGAHWKDRILIYGEADLKDGRCTVQIFLNAMRVPQAS